MELVEDHEAGSVERRIALEHPRQHALRHHLDARLPAHLRVEPDAVADRLPHALAERRRHPLRRRPRREPSGFEHHDPLPAEPVFIEERERNARRLARAGWGLQDGAGVLAQRRPEFGHEGVDGEVRHAH